MWEWWNSTVLVALVHVLLVMREWWNSTLPVALVHVLFVLMESQNPKTHAALVPTEIHLLDFRALRVHLDDGRLLTTVVVQQWKIVDEGR
ncbi:hypothetical protein HAX54_030122, partial [Datura stramonium]|nr:hypothetical protein [Datura stramonium]